MKKTEKATFEEFSTGEAPAIQAAAAETPEEREERLKREDYARRNLQAGIERERILRSNGVIGPDEPFSMDTEAALRQRCCH